MGNIPEQRVAVNQRPFTYCGVDYFGPITVAVGRRREKRWGVLFTCMTVRAVHIELAHSLSTESCLMAIRRFVAERGQPAEFMSEGKVGIQSSWRATLWRVLGAVGAIREEYASTYESSTHTDG